MDAVEPVYDTGHGIIGDGDRAEVHLNPIEPGGFRNLRKETIADVDLTLSRETIWSQPSIAHGRLFITRFAPKDYETLRADRIKNGHG